MLEIRQAQLQAFRDHAERDFRRRLYRRLRHIIPLEMMSDKDIESQIEAGVSQAQDCRMTREIDVARFVEAVFVHLGGFAAKGLPKSALPILYAYGVSPERRIDDFISWCGQRHAG
jgi:hypothetical protein